jgi:hypothetical protein
MTRAARISMVAATGCSAAVSLYLAVSVGFVGDGFRIAVGGCFLTGVSLLMLAGLVGGSPAWRRVATTALLAGLAGLLVWQVVLRDPISSPWLPRQLPFLIVGTIAAAVGIAARRPWGRWLALGGGWAGVIGFVWIAVVVFGADMARIQSYPLLAWRTVVFLVGSALLVMGTCGREMRAHFGAPIGSLWNAAGLRVGVLRASVLLSLASVPYLLMIGLGGDGPWAPRADAVLALSDAALVAAGAVLLIRQRTVGIVVTCAGAVGVGGLVLLELDRGPVAATLWLGTLAPAVLGAAIGLVAVAGPAWERLRSASRR